jgi:hypothetical protein
MYTGLSRCRVRLFLASSDAWWSELRSGELGWCGQRNRASLLLSWGGVGCWAGVSWARGQVRAGQGRGRLGLSTAEASGEWVLGVGGCVRGERAGGEGRAGLRPSGVMVCNWGGAGRARARGMAREQVASGGKLAVRELSRAEESRGGRCWVDAGAWWQWMLGEMRKR